MPPLPSPERKKLETAVVNARGAAEAAAGKALENLAVERDDSFPSMDQSERKLRKDLRARAKQLGAGVSKDGVSLLVEEIAYEQWHRMLFARFLAENGLLRHPSGASVSLADCAELAEEEGAADGWEGAARYAGAMLPGLFRADDPAVRVRFAPEGRAALEAILAPLPSGTFTADDALGWVYQFWQAKKKDEVNKSGRKIGGADLAPVTQLFTEDYMVRFLLENSLGAWWAARHPESPLLADWPYLRFLAPEETTDTSSDPRPPTPDPRRPAAGTFPGWPARAAEVTVMDPCCGSGHFLVAAFEMLRRMRMEEEGLAEAEAADAVLRDNLFGLELDPRCTQIAAFAVALAAWKVGGHPEAFPPRIACSGVPVAGQLDEWRRLAKGDANLRETLEQLHSLFKDAPTLGSLIDPRRLVTSQGMFAPRWEAVSEALKQVLATDEQASIFAMAAEGTVQAASLLVKGYTLIATNVPYLKRGRQDDTLRNFCDSEYPISRNDLATVFLERALYSVDQGCTVGIVCPQAWLLVKYYEDFRQMMLRTCSWSMVNNIGENGFLSSDAAGAIVSIVIVSKEDPQPRNVFATCSASLDDTPSMKERALRDCRATVLVQEEQLRNPGCRVTIERLAQTDLLERFAGSFAGVQSGDYPRFGRCFWEILLSQDGWRVQQSTVVDSVPYGGREHVLLWKQGQLSLFNEPGAYVRGEAAWSRPGIAVSQMRSLPVTLYTGELYDNNTAAIIPFDEQHLPAIWCYCLSREFCLEVRKLDERIKVSGNRTLVQIPFDLDRWQKVADEMYPNGLPEPHSDDPTQWLFTGHPAGSEAPLQVAVARLLGYAWPQQGEDDLGRFGDRDGIVCLPPIGGEQPAADRLRSLLAAAYGADWSPGRLDGLMAGVGFGGKDLAAWLRDGFFPQHCKLFHNRPFVWHVWDGRKDGFAALVNYHRLDGGALEKLAYTYLGTWIASQRAARDAGEAGAEGRLLAAREMQRKLIAIREGEPPFDLYVRWKPLHEQAIGWEPDLNDGVRLNVRPWVTAGVLRGKFTVSWNKDRGTNPDGSERLNDRHFTRKEKQEARVKFGGVEALTPLPPSPVHGQGGRSAEPR